MTPDSLYAALDCENADIDLILGQIADWYEERGWTWKAECLQWCRAEGKRPDASGWWYRAGPSCANLGGTRIIAVGEMWSTRLRASEYWKIITDAWHALRTRGEVPVAGIDSERMVTP